MKLSSPSQIYLIQPLHPAQPLPNTEDENKELTKLIIELKILESQSKSSTCAQRCKEIQARMLSNRNMLNTEFEHQHL